MSMEDINNAVNLVYDRTGLVPELDSCEELTAALLEWGDELAKENEALREQIKEKVNKQMITKRL